MNIMVVGKGLFLGLYGGASQVTRETATRANYPINLEDLWLANDRYLGHPSIDP